MPGMLYTCIDLALMRKESPESILHVFLSPCAMDEKGLKETECRSPFILSTQHLEIHSCNFNEERKAFISIATNLNISKPPHWSNLHKR